MSFHVPEGGRIWNHPILGSTPKDGNNGAFVVESPEPGWKLVIICSDGTEAPTRLEWQWEHVSVHAVRGPRDRTPTWKEMAFVKDLCWDADDVLIEPNAEQLAEAVGAGVLKRVLDRLKDDVQSTDPATKQTVGSCQVLVPSAPAYASSSKPRRLPIRVGTITVFVLVIIGEP